MEYGPYSKPETEPKNRSYQELLIQKSKVNNLF